MNNGSESPVLTRRERDVLQLIARGCTYSRVGDRLGVSEHTVASHIKNAYRKLEVHSAAAAVMRAMQLGLLMTEPPEISGQS
jgi:DNA-binding CsgD family transcriptional regulator